MKRPRVIAFLFICVVASSALALPHTPGCPFSCIRSIDLAHCVENYPATGNMASCEEIQRCWQSLGGEWYCDPPTCTGSQCYDV